ncbi:hypothetical protein DICPUDRAFT_151104 [Dictyostelium purpureum]|uniref:Uncharacterized protein n=1 Tax=Dictyostelium purpureum TaxID=5786 RepID=F0ZI01_DICPU|nr:uncharacterized protein DICPUDRAFT_151104 [Dictyostelium purpureum]EGC36408.1 hypothetical protein DICPUDRAFT_151104 [Dictyostelium purpureum]|eukprot:XP_003287041.1 hypothetical protein DICPUDRAFT_151104 [Dictyostelium purpureum]
MDNQEPTNQTVIRVQPLRQAQQAQQDYQENQVQQVQQIQKGTTSPKTGTTNSNTVDYIEILKLSYNNIVVTNDYYYLD